jgi:DNA mismatch endonuclease (patch repair protein)
LPGRPDFTFPKQRVCIFVHGCFWHNCPRCAKRSKTRPDYWSNKIETNKSRDRRSARELRRRGYKVFVVWECTLRRKNPIHAARRLVRLLGTTGVHGDTKPHPQLRSNTSQLDRDSDELRIFAVI